MTVFLAELEHCLRAAGLMAGCQTLSRLVAEQPIESVNLGNPNAIESQCAGSQVVSSENPEWNPAPGETARCQLTIRSATDVGEQSGGWRFRWQMSHQLLTAPISSRMGRSPELVAAWFRGLRAICASVGTDGGRLLVAPGTATADFALRAAELFGTPFSELQTLDPEQTDPVQWLRNLCQFAGENGRPSQDNVFVSPAFFGERTNCVDNPVFPSADVDLVDAADRVVAIAIRSQGNLHKLLSKKLVAREAHRGECRIVCGTNLTKDRVRDELLQLGAVGWTPLHTSGEILTVVTGETNPPQPAKMRSPRVAQLPTTDFLTHCTRRRHGPWPQQDKQTYLDDLILERPAADHSALAALTRIISDRRLIASDQLTRGKIRVVCFTAVPVRELQNLQVFRPHLGRWDFQPYGVSIRKEVMLAAGARPVCYASNGEWKNMPEENRPFFQLASDRDAHPGQSAKQDWTVEQEWRCVGDLNLRQFDGDDIVAFVPTDAEAEWLQQRSPWPVCVLSSSSPSS